MKLFMDFFRNKDKKPFINIAVILALGICLLVMSSTIFKPGTAPGDNTGPQKAEISQETGAISRDSYESSLEKRLEYTLSQVEGAGRVKALLTLSSGSELLVAENSTTDESNTKETDKDGGSREITTTRSDSQKIVVSEGSGGKPLILKEISPKIEGVIVVAQGGDNPVLKDALTKAAVAVLGLEPHKVQVLKMK